MMVLTVRERQVDVAVVVKIEEKDALEDARLRDIEILPGVPERAAAERLEPLGDPCPVMGEKRRPGDRRGRQEDNAHVIHADIIPKESPPVAEFHPIRDVHIFSRSAIAPRTGISRHETGRATDEPTDQPSQNRRDIKTIPALFHLTN